MKIQYDNNQVKSFVLLEILFFYDKCISTIPAIAYFIFYE